jgi:hypothetical protein
VGEKRFAKLHHLDADISAIPRSLEMIRKIPLEEIDDLRTLSDVYWRSLDGMMSEAFKAGAKGLQRETAWYLFSLWLRLAAVLRAERRLDCRNRRGAAVVYRRQPLRAHGPAVALPEHSRVHKLRDRLQRTTARPLAVAAREPGPQGPVQAGREAGAAVLDDRLALRRHAAHDLRAH